jgi:hypothetical protein
MAGHNNWYHVKLEKLSAHNEFTINFNVDKPTQLMSFQDATDYTANLIYQQSKNIFLGLSGGLDSEFVANVFVRNNIPFTPIILTFNKTKEHYYALEWCEVNNIIPTIVDVSEDDKDFVKYANWLSNFTSTQVHSMSMTCYMSRIVKKHGGKLIHADPTLVKITNGFYDPVTDQLEISWYEFLLELVYPAEHVGGFFFHTPELALAYATELDTSLSNNRAKTKLYKNVAYRPKNWPPVVPISDMLKRKIKFQYHKPLVTVNCEWTKEKFIMLLTDLNNNV